MKPHDFPIIEHAEIIENGGIVKTFFKIDLYRLSPINCFNTLSVN